MAAKSKDPTAALRAYAATYDDVTEGTSCSQTSFKAGKKAFLYVGPQGGRFKAMFKLKDSMPEAEELAEADPDRFQVGNTSWVTARFDAKKPLPKRIWKRWLDESYALAT
ncbi:MAG: MmcQ/YjbR family DNA-binding protein [Planctomycetota bacterium]|nr:MmcQ/YjbR family DNA-binding protein [Planctomycetota bacterium]